MSNQKEKKHLYIEYIKTHQLEKLISELTNSLFSSFSFHKSNSVHDKIFNRFIIRRRKNRK